MASAVLIGCAQGGPLSAHGEKSDWDIGEAPRAIVAAVPRVTEVSDPERSLNGFQYSLSLTLSVDSNEPFTATELDAVVEAIWTEIPWEPNGIVLYAYAAGTQQPLDLRPAAAELAPMGFRNASQGGAVRFYDMRARYGDWTAP